MPKLRGPTYASVGDHPNLGAIRQVLARVPHIGDADLLALARAWRNSAEVADARSRALAVDTPLVIDCLAAFDRTQALFADDLTGEHPDVTTNPAVAALALKAIRDAIAGCFARPVLTRAEHAALLGPWQRVFPDTAGPTEADLGPHADAVRRLVDTLGLLSARCHDPDAGLLYVRLAEAARSVPADNREVARDSGWQAAVTSSRRRVWTHVRHTGSAAMARRCGRCGPRPPDRDGPRVLDLCLDAACILVVADAVDAWVTDTVVQPLAGLIPLPRPGR